MQLRLHLELVYCLLLIYYAPCSGVAKGGPGWARAWPKHHVRPAHVTQSRAKHGLAYSRCLANTNDLATPLAPWCT